MPIIPIVSRFVGTVHCGYAALHDADCTTRTGIGIVVGSAPASPSNEGVTPTVTCAVTTLPESVRPSLVYSSEKVCCGDGVVTFGPSTDSGTMSACEPVSSSTKCEGPPPTLTRIERPASSAVEGEVKGTT